MRNDLKDALQEHRRDAIATSITVGILSPMIHHVAAFTWPEAIGVVLAPVVMMLAVKLVIDGWFGPAELDPDEAELVDVHVDRRDRLQNSWRPRPKGQSPAEPEPFRRGVPLDLPAWSPSRHAARRAIGSQALPGRTTAAHPRTGSQSITARRKAGSA